MVEGLTIFCQSHIKSVLANFEATLCVSAIRAIFCVYVPSLGPWGSSTRPRDGAAVARRAHNPKVGGSNPSPATKNQRGPSQEGPLSLRPNRRTPLDTSQKKGFLVFWRHEDHP